MTSDGVQGKGSAILIDRARSPSVERAADAARLLLYDRTMAITGAHALIYTSEPDAVRALFRDVFGWSNVDAGDGWLIFALPPAELAVHPAEDAARHEVSLMCDDLPSTMAELRERGVDFEADPADEGWGIAVTMLLPGGGKMLLYEPRHATAIAQGAGHASTP